MYVEAQLNGGFYFNHTPMALLGTKYFIFGDNNKQAYWQPHGVE